MYDFNKRLMSYTRKGNDRHRQRFEEQRKQKRHRRRRVVEKKKLKSNKKYLKKDTRGEETKTEK